jgi:monoterpene epsilon-lactone hydrolase
VASIEDVKGVIADLIGSADASIERRREQGAAFGASAAIPDGIEIRGEVFAGVRVECIRQATLLSSAPVFIHLHGGGYVMGDPAGSRPFTTEVARRAEAHVVSIDYGLAPDSAFPRAVADGLKVYRHLLGRLPPARMAIGGESAGGGLAVSILLAALDEALPMPSACVAVSPWANLACDNNAYSANAEADPMLTRGVLLEMADAYLAGADPGHRWASPGTADLTGLPPMLIQAGSAEVLAGDAVELAESAKRAGVSVDLEICESMIHVWHMFHPILPEGSEAIDRIARFLRSHWGGDVSTPRRNDQTTR